LTLSPTLIFSKDFSGGSFIPEPAELGPSGHLIDRQPVLVEENRVAENAHLVQRIATLAFDACEPVYEHVIEQHDLAVKKPVLELLRHVLAGVVSIFTNA
jgi:hypothetical protein